MRPFSVSLSKPPPSTPRTHISSFELSSAPFLCEKTKEPLFTSSLSPVILSGQV